MVIFLYGPDTYRLQKIRDDYLERYTKKYSSGLNIFKIDANSSGGLGEFENAIKSSSFFNEHKLVLLNDFLEKKENSKKLAGLIKDCGLISSSDVTVIIFEPGENKKAGDYKEIENIMSKSGGLMRKVDFLKGRELEKWVTDEFGYKNGNVTLSTVQKLIAAVGNNSWALANEVAKLVNFGAGKTITKEDIDMLVVLKTNMNIFEFTDAVARKDQKKFIQLLYQELKTGRDPYYILTMIAFQLRNMIIIKDLLGRNLSQSEIAKKAGIHPFVVKKTSAGLDKFKQNELKFLYQKLLDMDILSKQGNINLADSLFGLLFKE